MKIIEYDLEIINWNEVVGFVKVFNENLRISEL